MKTVRKKTKAKKTKDATMDKSPKNKIPQEKLREFVGEVSDLFMIRAEYLWGENDVHRFRINVWIKEKMEDCLGLSQKITKSYFVHYNGGVIVDKTTKPKIEKRSIF